MLYTGQEGLIASTSNTNVDKKLLDIISSGRVDPSKYPLVKEAYEKWKKDTSYFSKYANFIVKDPGSILVRLFCYSEQSNLLAPNSSLVKGEEKYLENIEILPRVKVIKTCNVGFGDKPPKFKEGDILVAPDSISEVVVSKEWAVWKHRMEVERPNANIPEPSRFGGVLAQWSVAKFTVDVLNRTADDDYTFILQDSLFKLVDEN